MEVWRWSPGKLKIHVDPLFGKHLRRRHKMKPSAEYRDRSGILVGYDFVISKSERNRLDKSYRKFCAKKW